MCGVREALSVPLRADLAIALDVVGRLAPTRTVLAFMRASAPAVTPARVVILAGVPLFGGRGQVGVQVRVRRTGGCVG
jgi:hypothetical protein